MTNMEYEEKNSEETSLPTQMVNGGHEKLSNVEPASCNFNPAETTQSEPMLCAHCQKPIYDQYYMWVDKRTWHESCVQCDVCRRPLAESCYAKNHKLYCSQDYKQLQKCRKCSQLIPLTDFVLHVCGQPFHVTCFACDSCHQQLQSGDQYLVDESTNRIYCKSCNDQSDRFIVDQEMDVASDSDGSEDDIFSHQAVGISEMNYITGYADSAGLHHAMMQTKNGVRPILTSMSSCGDGKRVKRPRTILTTAQRRKFKASFEVSQKPCRKVRETLAAETGLTPRVVQVWFQNQRAKMKKLARRQGDGSGSNKNRSSHKVGRKKTTDSDSDNELSSPGSYISTPTPHLSSYHDTYTSPRSLQTSPTTSVTDIGSYGQPLQNLKDSNGDFFYDDFDSSIFSGADTYMTQTSKSTTQALSVDVGHKIEEVSHTPDYHSNCTPLENDAATVPSPHDNFQQFGNLQCLTPYPNPVRSEGTPIDRLMCMQSTFFRT